MIWATLGSFGLGDRLVQSRQNAGEGSKAEVKIGNELGKWLNISIGTKQDDPASTSQFIAYLERAIDGIQNNGTAVTIQGERINDSCEALQEKVRLLDKAGKDLNLNINIAETKTLLFSKTDIQNNLSSEVKKLNMSPSLFTWLALSLQKTTAEEK